MTAIDVVTVTEFPALTRAKHAIGSQYRFHTMIKPSGAQCNLDCRYCFYLHKEQLLGQPKRPRMDDEVLEQHIRQYIQAQTGDQVVFSWQGGEPTLMGLHFFRRVVALQQKYARPGLKIENDLQTNGTLLDEEWCQFLKQHNFVVGLSVDGPEEFHDLHRYSKTGGKTFAAVVRAARLLHAHEIPFSALCVINRDNAEYPLEVYRFLRDEISPRLIQFIPGMEKADFVSAAPGSWDKARLPREDAPEALPGNPGSAVADWSVAPLQWGRFLTRVWDEWLARDYGKVFVDQFENVLSMITGQGSQQCVTSQVCGKAMALEHNGDLYSCDHFVYPEYRLGNIRTEHQGDLAFSERQQAFGYAKSANLPAKCKQCAYLKLCWGHCPKDRFLKTTDNEPGLHYLCQGLTVFYRHVIQECDRLSG